MVSIENTLCKKNISFSNLYLHFFGAKSYIRESLYEIVSFPKKLRNYCSDCDNVPLLLHPLGSRVKFRLIMHGVEQLVI